MIPVFEPDFGEEEIAAVVAAMRRGEISGSFGESIPRFEEAFAAYCGCKYGIAVGNGTASIPWRNVRALSSTAVLTPADLTKVPEARLIPELSIAPGHTAARYAFVRQGKQSNLYRITLP